MVFIKSAGEEGYSTMAACWMKRGSLVPLCFCVELIESLQCNMRKSPLGTNEEMGHSQRTGAPHSHVLLQKPVRDRSVACIR